MNFKLWSEINKEAKDCLKPNLGYRTFDELNKKDRENLWFHLIEFFYGTDLQYGHGRGSNDKQWYFPFTEPNIYEKQDYITATIQWLIDTYKSQDYAPNFLKERSIYNACVDFYSIFIHAKGHVVLELLSMYCLAILQLRQSEYIPEYPDDTKETYKARKEEYVLKFFDDFRTLLNDVLEDFRVNVLLTRNGFAPRQDKVIVNKIVEPALSLLSDEKWNKVNEILRDGFNDFNENTPQSYSACVTNIVSALQAFLQILVNGKTGSGDISKLISEAQRKELIPSDAFTKDIFKNIESILARERQETSIAHPKNDYSNERNAKMVINLAMIFFQHCLTEVKTSF